MRKHLAALVAITIAALVLGGSLASAQNDEALQFLDIREVDASDPDTIEMIVGFNGAASALQSATIIENGVEVTPSGVEPLTGDDTLVVLIVDTSEAMRDGDALTRVKRTLEDLVEARPDGQRMGVIALGGGARVVQGPTNDTTRLITAVDGLAYQGSAGTTSGFDAAARMIAQAGERQSHVVMVVGGGNTGAVPGPRARGVMASSGAAAWVVALEDRGAGGNEGFLRSVVNATGGAYFGTVNLDAVPGYLDDITTRIENHYVVTYPSRSSGPIDLTVEAGGEQARVSFVSGGVASGATALAPAMPRELRGIGFLRDNGWTIGLLAGVLAAVLAAFAIGSLIFPDRSDLDHALEVYTEAPASASWDEDDDGSGYAKTALIQRAVGLTEQFAERQGVLARVEATLERGDLPLRAAEAMFFYAVSFVLLGILAFVLTGGNILGTLVVTAIIGLMPAAAVNFIAARRQKKFEQLLPDTLQLLAGTLRAGYSLMQGVEAVSREVSEPMGKELRRVVTESRLGRPLEESMDASAQRMDSADFAWAVMAIKIQRDVGGNLAELLMTVSDTMTQRERLRRDVDALTAEGKVSAMVLGALPVGLGAFLYMGNPGYIGVLFEETMGQVMVAGAIVLALIGFVWMRKVIQVDV